MDNPKPPQRPQIAFGPFVLIAEERRLERDGVLVRIGGKAMDILQILLENPGKVVEKRALLERVWQDVNVDDVSMRVHINALRKALGDGVDGARYIVNVPGRGYCFVAPVQHPHLDLEPLLLAQSPAAPTTLPSRPLRMIGRTEAVEEIKTILRSYRFLSVIGPGGIGKTTVAVAAGHEMLNAFTGEVYFIDFGSLTDPTLLPNVIVSALGVTTYSENLMESLLAFVRHKKLLLIFDNCEHVIEKAAEIIEKIYLQAPEIHILTTSREALLVQGERVYRLGRLETPPEDAELPTETILSFTAVQLFVERAAVASNTFRLSDADAPLVAEICRRLDGIALAIELAASRVDAYGVHTLADLLSNNLMLPWRGRRTAVARHQTLGATLDWSYNLLSDTERIVLNRAALFISSFSRDALTSIAVFGGITQSDVLEVLASLVGKSLISAEPAADVTMYRLLDTTRAYALEKLAQRDETRIVSKRHALHYCHVLKHIVSEATGGSNPAWKAQFSDQLPNVRLALEWSISNDGDSAIAMELAAASARPFLELALFSECHRWMAQVLTIFDETTRGTFRELEIQTSLAQALMFAKGSETEGLAAFKRALDISEAISDADYQLRIHTNLHLFYERMGDFGTAAEFAKNGYKIALAIGNSAGLAVASAALGISCHLAGEHKEATRLLEHALGSAAASHRMGDIFFGFDCHTRSSITLARELWLQGMPDQAILAAKNAVVKASQLDQPVAHCIALIWAVSVLIWAGEYSFAEEYTGELRALAQKHSLMPYLPLADGFSAEILLRAGDPSFALEALQNCLSQLRESGYGLMTIPFMAAQAEGLLAARRNADALNAVEETIRLAQCKGDLYILPELTRIKANICAQQPDTELSTVEAMLRGALNLARQRSAPGWALRAATSLAQLYRDGRDIGKARDILEPVYGAFSEGFDTADLKAARFLLDL